MFCSALGRKQGLLSCDFILIIMVEVEVETETKTKTKTEISEIIEAFIYLLYRWMVGSKVNRPPPSSSIIIMVGVRAVVIIRKGAAMQFSLSINQLGVLAILLAGMIFLQA